MTPNMTPEIWHLEDGTPVYMYSMLQFEHMQSQQRANYFGTHATKSSLRNNHPLARDAYGYSTGTRTIPQFNHA